jgi:uncharacterized membrane protein
MNDFEQQKIEEEVVKIINTETNKQVKDSYYTILILCLKIKITIITIRLMQNNFKGNMKTKNYFLQ